MKCSYRNLIAFSCVLLLQLGILVSVVHAVEHPFHAQNELCASFINFGHHDVNLDAKPLGIASALFSVVTVADSNSSLYFTSPVFYSARAPPVLFF